MINTNLTKELVDEHKLIKKMISVLENAVKRFKENNDLDILIFEKAIDFIPNYADKFHHAKEEDILFKEMLNKNMPKEDGPIQAMLIEHEQGRDFVKGMKKSIDELNKSKDNKKKEEKNRKDEDKIKQDEIKQNLIKNAKGYIELLKEHIDKEDNILYPLAEKIFNDDEKQKQLTAFDKANKNKGGKNTVEKYEKIVKDLEKE